ncbi:MAG: aldose epimerase family protein [Verrucomicrobiota bacterium]|jgi:aldose 1-epimerase
MSTIKRMIPWMFACGAGAWFLAGCASESASTSTIDKQPFGTGPNGEAVDIFTLHNNKGAEARIMTYGGIVVSLKMPDKNGHFDDVVLGCDNLEPYLNKTPYFGALIGRYGNRIGGAKFTLDGTICTLDANDGPNMLHGGFKGFDKRVWTARSHKSADGPQLVLSYLSKDGEEGFPGNLNVTATYTLMNDNSLRLEFHAVTDKDTVVNLTHHSYFNLAGQGDILGHVVMIPADRFTPVDATLIPTGELRPVENTPFDFRVPTAIGARIGQEDEQLKFGKGYDHNWVVNKKAGYLSLMARVSEPSSGRVMEVWSTEPGLQFYSGNFLDGTITGKGGSVYAHRSAFCMEPQHFPDSPNKPEFPTVELKPGEVFDNIIIYHFSVQP